MCPTNQEIISLDISTTTKQKAIVNTQKRIRKEYKYSIKENIKPQKKRGKEERNREEPQK